MPDERPSHYLSLSGIQGGAAETLFQAALARVLANIDDPNTAAAAKRQIVLTLTFKPGEEDRRSASVTVECATKLARMRPLGTIVSLSRANGALAAVEVLSQEALDLQFP